MNESNVFITHEPIPVVYDGKARFKDLSSAERYGKITNIFAQDDLISMAPGPAANKAARMLKDFDAKKDYLCYAGGDPLSLSLAILALRNMNIKEVSYLRWDRSPKEGGVRSKGFYIPQSIPLF